MLIVAAAIAPAYAAVRDLRRVDVWNINPDRAKQLVSRLRDEGFQAEVAIDLAQAVAQADIVSCATLSTQPLVLREWLRPGTHLDLIGSFKPDMRESDDATFSDTSVFIDTEEALDKSGDLLAPIAAGLFARDRVLGTLADLCHQRHPGHVRRRDHGVQGGRRRFRGSCRRGPGLSRSVRPLTCYRPSSKAASTSGFAQSGVARLMTRLYDFTH